MSSFISQNLTEIEDHTVFWMISCLQINWQPFYLRQRLKFHPFNWLIEIYLQTEGQGTHHKMVSLQPMPGFLLCYCTQNHCTISWQLIALGACVEEQSSRISDHSEVTKSHPKGDDDIEFSIDWFHKWIEAIKKKLPNSMLSQAKVYIVEIE